MPKMEPLDHAQATMRSTAMSVPITAACFVKSSLPQGLENWLLVGRGSLVELYNIEQRRLAARIELHSNCRVHGIRPVANDPGEFLVFGRQSVHVVRVKLEASPALALARTPVVVPDWVVDVAQQHDKTLVILGARGDVFVCDSSSLAVSRRYHRPPDAPGGLLSMGRLFFNGAGQLVVFAATALGSFYAYQIGHEPQLLTLFESLEGCVFDVAWNQTTGILAAACEDRSVRVFEGVFCEKPTGLLKARTTLFGHTERVWRVAFCGQGQSRWLASTSQGRVVLWDLLAGVAAAHWSVHRHTSAWAAAVSTDGSLLATGGDAGGLELLSVFEAVDRPRVELAGPRGGRPAAFAVVDGRRCVFVADGAVRMRVLGPEGPLDMLLWDAVLPNELESSAVRLAASASANVAAVGTPRGSIAVLDLGGKAAPRHFAQLHNGKVLALAIGVGRDGSSVVAAVGLDGWVSVIRGSAFWRVRVPEKATSNGNYARSVSFVAERDVLVIGMRERGTVVVVSAAEDADEVPTVLEEWCSDGNAVVATVQHAGVLVTATRSSQLLAWQWCPKKREGVRLARIPLPLTWVARLSIVENRLLAVGFHAKELVVLDVAADCSLLQRAFAGSEQHWDLAFSDLALRDGQLAVFHKTAQLDPLHRECVPGGGADVLGKNALVPSLHGAKIVQCCLLDSNGFKALTAGEDGRLCVSTVTSSAENAMIRPTATLHMMAELKAMAAVQVSTGNNWLVFMGGPKGAVRVLCAPAPPGVPAAAVETGALAGPPLSGGGRVLCLDAVAGNSGLVYCVAGYADGTVALWTLDEASSAETVLTGFTQLESAATSVAVLPNCAGVVAGTSKGAVVLLVPRDGSLAVAARSGRTRGGAALGLALMSHNPTTNPNTHVIAVGDDGGAVAVYTATCAGGAWTMQPAAARADAHAAAVTGVAWAGPLVVSSSIDQRISAWRFSDATLAHECSALSSVADVQCVAARRSSSGKWHVAVGGIGLELFQLGA